MKKTMQGKHGKSQSIVLNKQKNKPREAERNLLSESALKAIAKTLLDGILVVDEKDTILFSNSRFGEMWQIPAEILRLKNRKKLFPIISKQLKNPKDFLQKINYWHKYKDKKTYDELLLKDGRVYERYSSPFCDLKREVCGRICFFRDISKRKKIENEITYKNLLFDGVIKSVPDGILLVDANGKTLFFNYAFGKMWQIPQKILKQKDDKQLLASVLSRLKYPEKFIKRVNYLYAHPNTNDYEQIEFKDGRFFERYSSCLKDSNNNYSGRIWFFRDITARKKVEDELLKYRQQLEHLVAEKTKSLKLEIVERKKIEEKLQNNLEFEILIGKIAKDFSKLEFQDINIGIQKALGMVCKFAKIDRARIFEFLDDGTTMRSTHEWCAKGQKPIKKYLQNFLRASVPLFNKQIVNTDIFYVPDISSLPAKWRSEKNIWLKNKIKSIICVPLILQKKVIGFLAFESINKIRIWDERSVSLFSTLGSIISGVLERQEAAKTIEKLAKQDILTCLPNRFQFEVIANKNIAYAKRHKKLLAIMSIDLDKFKDINDSYGHDIGDLLLKEVGTRLSMNIRTEDFVSRMGGDEFAVIMVGLKKTTEAGILAKKIIEVIQKPYQLGHYKLKITTSIGITIFPRDGEDKSKLLKNADIAMYKAKALGRNNYQYFYK